MQYGKKKIRIWGTGLALVIGLLTAPFEALAAQGMFEFSTGLSFYQNTYSAGNYAWERRWGASFGFHLTDISEIEMSFQDVTNRTVLVGLENTTFHDQIYSIDWVQSLVGKSSPIQPYVKAGLGQLNRNSSGTYANGLTPPVLVDSLTGVLGAGLRIYLTRTFAIRGEVTSYLNGGAISTWQDNFSGTLGASIFF